MEHCRGSPAAAAKTTTAVDRLRQKQNPGMPWIACGSRKKKNYCCGSPAAEAQARPTVERLRQKHSPGTAAEFAANVDRKQLRSCTTEHGVGGDPFTAMRQLSGTHWTSRTNVSANSARAEISIQTISTTRFPFKRSCQWPAKLLKTIKKYSIVLIAFEYFLIGLPSPLL